MIFQTSGQGGWLCCPDSTGPLERRLQIRSWTRLIIHFSHCLASGILLFPVHPISTSDSKPKPWKITPSLAPLDVEVDKQLRFPELLLAMATVYQTIGTARLLSEVEMGCMYVQ
jgi:hypothetical protein